VGKSVCALQAAKTFADRGWSVFKVADPAIDHIDWLPSTERNILYIIDDAHLMAGHVLQAAEAGAGRTRMLILVANSQSP
jgi:hypothetical protein